MRILALCAILALVGCGAQRIEIPEPVIRKLADPPISRLEAQVPDVSGDLREIRSEVKASTNLTQNSITGLGANLGKVAETVQGFGGDLARINAEIRSNVEARADVSATLKASLQAQADLRAQLAAMAQAQVGLKNEIDQLTISTKSGRDSIVQTVQFSKEMRDTLIASYESNKYTVWVMSGAMLAVVSAFLDFSRRRAEQRSRDHLAELRLMRETHVAKAGLGHNGNGVKEKTG